MADLEDLYREIILDHYRSPRNRGELPCPPAHRAEGFNPLCGDEVIIYLETKDGKLTDLKTGGQGCSISQSSASLMSEAIKGKSVDEIKKIATAFKAMLGIESGNIEGIREESSQNGEGPEASEAVKLGDMEALKGVMKFPVRIKCAVLGWNTLLTELEELQNS